MRGRISGFILGSKEGFIENRDAAGGAGQLPDNQGAPWSCPFTAQGEQRSCYTRGVLQVDWGCIAPRGDRRGIGHIPFLIGSRKDEARWLKGGEGASPGDGGAMIRVW